MKFLYILSILFLASCQYFSGSSEQKETSIPSKKEGSVKVSSTFEDEPQEELV